MEELMRLIDRKFLKDTELVELEDSEFVISCKYTKPYNAHYNTYEVIIINDGIEEEHTVYLKYR